MKKLLSISFVLLIMSICFSACSSIDEADPGMDEVLTAETRIDVSYGTNPQQVFDIYLPEGRSTSKTKVILLIHGGGWIEGDKADMDGFITLVQQNHPNHAIVNMNYVLATASQPAFPNQFLDVQLVIAKLTAEMSELAIFPEFGLIGVSAGAHLAMQYDYVYDTEDQVKMVVDIVGPTDFTDPFFADNPNFQVLMNIFVDESAYPNTTDYATATSPAQQVTSRSSPTLMFYGNRDELVPLSNGDRLNEALSAADITHTYNVYNAGHGDFTPADGLDLQLQTSAYINTYLEIEE